MATIGHSSRQMAMDNVAMQSDRQSAMQIGAAVAEGAAAGLRGCRGLLSAPGEGRPRRSRGSRPLESASGGQAQRMEGACAARSCATRRMAAEGGRLAGPGLATEPAARGWEQKRRGRPNADAGAGRTCAHPVGIQCAKSRRVGDGRASSSKSKSRARAEQEKEMSRGKRGGNNYCKPMGKDMFGGVVQL